MDAITRALASGPAIALCYFLGWFALWFALSVSLWGWERTVDGFMGMGKFLAYAGGVLGAAWLLALFLRWLFGKLFEVVE